MDIEPEASAPTFVLSADTSDVLLQSDNEGGEHVIVYVSIRFNEKMRQKSATERKLFAIHTSVRHFRLPDSEIVS